MHSTDTTRQPEINMLKIAIVIVLKKYWTVGSFKARNL